MKGAAIFNGCQGIGNANAKNSKKEEEVPQRPRARRKIALYLRVLSCRQNLIIRNEWIKIPKWRFVTIEVSSYKITRIICLPTTNEHHPGLQIWNTIKSSSDDDYSTIDIHSLSVPNPNRFQQAIRWHPPVLLWNLEGISPEQCRQLISHSQTWSGICSVSSREVFEFKIGAGLQYCFVDRHY